MRFPPTSQRPPQAERRAPRDASSPEWHRVAPCWAKRYFADRFKPRSTSRARERVRGAGIAVLSRAGASREQLRAPATVRPKPAGVNLAPYTRSASEAGLARWRDEPRGLPGSTTDSRRWSHRRPSPPLPLPSPPLGVPLCVAASALAWSIRDPIGPPLDMAANLGNGPRGVASSDWRPIDTLPAGSLGPASGRAASALGRCPTALPPPSRGAGSAGGGGLGQPSPLTAAGRCPRLRADAAHAERPRLELSSDRRDRICGKPVASSTLRDYEVDAVGAASAAGAARRPPSGLTGAASVRGLLPSASRGGGSCGQREGLNAGPGRTRPDGEGSCSIDVRGRVGGRAGAATDAAFGRSEPISDCDDRSPVPVLEAAAGQPLSTLSSSSCGPRAQSGPQASVDLASAPAPTPRFPSSGCPGASGSVAPSTRGALGFAAAAAASASTSAAPPPPSARRSASPPPSPRTPPASMADRPASPAPVDVWRPVWAFSIALGRAPLFNAALTTLDVENRWPTSTFGLAWGSGFSCTIVSAFAMFRKLGGIEAARDLPQTAEDAWSRAAERARGRPERVAVRPRAAQPSVFSVDLLLTAILWVLEAVDDSRRSSASDIVCDYLRGSGLAAAYATSHARQPTAGSAQTTDPARAYPPQEHVQRESDQASQVQRSSGQVGRVPATHLATSSQQERDLTGRAQTDRLAADAQHEPRLARAERPVAEVSAPAFTAAAASGGATKRSLEEDEDVVTSRCDESCSPGASKRPRLASAQDATSSGSLAPSSACSVLTAEVGMRNDTGVRPTSSVAPCSSTSFVAARSDVAVAASVHSSSASTDASSGPGPGPAFPLGSRILGSAHDFASGAPTFAPHCPHHPRSSRPVLPGRVVRVALGAACRAPARSLTTTDGEPRSRNAAAALVNPAAPGPRSRQERNARLAALARMYRGALISAQAIVLRGLEWSVHISAQEVNEAVRMLSRADARRAIRALRGRLPNGGCDGTQRISSEA